MFINKPLSAIEIAQIADSNNRIMVKVRMSLGELQSTIFNDLLSAKIADDMCDYKIQDIGYDLIGSILSISGETIAILRVNADVSDIINEEYE